MYNNYINYLRNPGKTPSVYINVYCRFRPLTEIEEEAEKEKEDKDETISVISPNQIILVPHNKKSLEETYTFDNLFDNQNQIEEIYNILYRRMDQ